MLTKQPCEPKPFYQDDGLQLFSTQILMQLSPRVFAAREDYMEVVLERDSTEESWGLVWHVQGYKAQNLGFSTATCFFGCRCLW